MKKQRSTGDITSKGVQSIRSTGSTTSWMSSESGYPTGAGSVVSQGSDASFAGEVLNSVLIKSVFIAISQHESFEISSKNDL